MSLGEICHPLMIMYLEIIHLTQISELHKVISICHVTLTFMHHTAKMYPFCKKILFLAKIFQKDVKCILLTVQIFQTENVGRKYLFNFEIQFEQMQNVFLKCTKQ